MPFTPPPGAVQNEYGFWQDAEGNLIPGQQTPGALKNPGGQSQYDAERDLDYTTQNGQRVYASPVSYDMTQDRPTTQYRTSKGGAEITDKGGGMVHGAPHWNSQTGKWDVGLDYGKVLSYAAGAGIGASYAIPALAAMGGGSAAPAAAAVPSAAAAPAAAAPAILPAASAVTGGSVSTGGGILGTAQKLYGMYNKGKELYDEYGGLIGAGGDIARGAEQGRAQGRVSEADIQQAQDRVALQRAQLETQQADSRNQFGLNAAGVDLNQRNFALEAPGRRASNAVRGDILSRAQDVSFGNVGPNVRIPTISGGLRPSMFSGATRQLGTDMTNQALAGQQAGDTFAPLAYQAPAPIPELTALPQAGKVDTILNTAGIVGTGVDVFQDWLKNRKPKAAAPRNDATASTDGFMGPTQEFDPSLNA